MITSVIFSKNRACQLDLLLRSMDKNLPFQLAHNTVVLYKATIPEFKHGYWIINERYPNLIMIEEKDFKKDTLKIFEAFCCEYTCFFVDDDIVYRRPRTTEHDIECVLDRSNYACFSLRLGSNTLIQDPYTQKPVHPLPNFYQFKYDDSEAMLSWVWSQLPMNNFGYPFSVDGHIYKTDLLIKLLDYEFDTPNALEGRFQREQLPHCMASFYESCVVNNPINLVGSSENKAGIYFGHTLEDLNTKFLDGYNINLEHLEQNDIVGCHQEMEIDFV